jgi:uracil-DNA glycosylase
MLKPLMIGEAPSKNEHVPQPLSGRVGKRMAECCGLTLEEFLDFFERTNLLKERQDTKEKGFEFDSVAAALEAEKLWHDGVTFHNDRVVLLLGHRVATAFGAANVYLIEQHLGTRAKVYVLPHPSGVNRWWNESANVKTMNEFMRRVVVEARK